MIKAKEISPQTCDMGSNFVVYELSENTDLRTVLNWIKNNMHSWGTITIQYSDGEVIRKFDYDLYREKEFYINLSGWEAKLEVGKMSSSACFMYCDFEIIVRK